MNDDDWPTVKVPLADEVIVGVSSTAIVSVCVDGSATSLSAVIVTVYEPPVPAVGVPDKLAVPSPLSWRLTPEGRAPVTVSAGVG